MPVSAQAARLTDIYRTAVLRNREAAIRLITRSLAAINLDDLDLLDRWVRDATATVLAAQDRVGLLTISWMVAYLRASDVRPTTVGMRPVGVAVGRDGRPVERLLDQARVALLWQLGRHAGRDRAVATGVAEAARIGRSAVMHTARATAAAQMEAEPEVQGWRRVTSSRPCGACLALATRTIHSPTVNFRAHSHCRCTAEPVVADRAERVRRPTGQELWDGMTPQEKAEFFAGRGGADKARLVDQRGLDVLVDTTGDETTEASLAAIASS